MHVLVTGATGRVGSRFVPRLIDHGDRVRIFARDTDLARPLVDRGAELVSGDLRDADAVRRAVTGVDAVVHLGAALRGVAEDEAFAVNRDAAVSTARLAAEAGAQRFVFVSTNLVYGPGRGRPACEDDAPMLAKPHPYAASKIEAEEAVRAMHQPGMFDVRIARLAFVYGEGDPHLAEVVNWATHWPSHKRLHLVHHADVARALIRIIHAGGLDGRIYNVADDAPVTALELLAINRAQCPDDLSARELTDPWEGIVSVNRLRADTGFRPLFPTMYAAQDAGAL